MLTTRKERNFLSFHDQFEQIIQNKIIIFHYEYILFKNSISSDYKIWTRQFDLKIKQLIGYFIWQCSMF